MYVGFMFNNIQKPKNTFLYAAKNQFQIFAFCYISEL